MGKSDKRTNATEAADAASVTLRLLGTHRLATGTGEIKLKTRRAWALLAYLVANRGRAIPRDEVAALLWDRSAQEQARASLRQELSTLRGALRRAGWSPVGSTKSELTFEPGDAWIDLVAFEDVLVDGERAEGSSISDAYGGPFLHDLNVGSDAFTRWQDRERARLAALAVESQIALLGTEGDRATGEEAGLIARNILAIEPANERAWREVMRAYAAQGRRAEALRQYAACRQALYDELDARPSAATVELAETIKAQGGSLQPAVKDRQSGVEPEPAAAEEAPPPALAMAGRKSRSRLWRRPTLGRRTRWAAIGLSALTALFAGGAAVAGVQYYAAGQRVTPANLACYVPFFWSGRNEPIHVGAILPSNKEHGERLRWGFDKFLRDRRTAYPFSYRLVFGDSQEGLETIPGILRTFDENGVLAVVGPLESRKAWDVKKWGNTRQVPVVSPLASASYLTGVGGKDYFFRVSMSDSERAKALVGWLRARNLHNDPYVLNEVSGRPREPNEPEIYGASQATAAKSHLDYVESIRFVRGDDESNLAAADRVKNDGRAVLIFGYTSNIIRIIRRMQENGVENPIFLMGVVQKRLEDAGFPFPGKLHVVDWVQSEARDFGNARQLRQDYVDTGPKDVDYDPSAYYTYDSMDMVLGAVQRARARTCRGAITGRDVAEELRRMPPKRRKVIHKSFMPETQEIHYEWDGLRIIDGRFRPVGLGG